MSDLPSYPEANSTRARNLRPHTARPSEVRADAVTVDDTLKMLAGDRPEHVSSPDQAVVRGYPDALTSAQRRADDVDCNGVAS